MRHLFDTPISGDRASVNSLIFFGVPYFIFLIHLLAIKDKSVIGGLSVLLLFFIVVLAVTFNEAPLHTKEFELIKYNYLTIKADEFFVLYKYKLITGECYQGIYFMTKKAVIRYCLELEKKKLKEGANNIPSVMRLQAML